jgi:hypothetical protein
VIFMNYRIIYKDELYHYGVPGMRWGHRKAQPISLAGTGHRAMAGVYGINQRFYNRTGNKTMASMNAQARNRALKKAAAADIKKQQKVNSPEHQAKVARAKKAAKVGAAVGVAALATYGAYKYKSLSKEMSAMNSSISRGKARVDSLTNNFSGGHEKVTYLGNDFRMHTASRGNGAYSNIGGHTQQTFNSVRDYARAKKRYTGRY